MILNHGFRQPLSEDFRWPARRRRPLIAACSELPRRLRSSPVGGNFKDALELELTHRAMGNFSSLSPLSQTLPANG